VLNIIADLLYLFLLVLIAYSILSWFTASGRLAYDSPVIKIQRVLSAICEPVLRPVRRLTGTTADPSSPGRRGRIGPLGVDCVPGRGCSHFGLSMIGRGGPTGRWEVPEGIRFIPEAVLIHR
jgi:hypothetical protein